MSNYSGQIETHLSQEANWPGRRDPHKHLRMKTQLLPQSPFIQFIVEIYDDRNPAKSELENPNHLKYTSRECDELAAKILISAANRTRGDIGTELHEMFIYLVGLTNGKVICSNCNANLAQLDQNPIVFVGSVAKFGLKEQ